MCSARRLSVSLTITRLPAACSHEQGSSARWGGRRTGESSAGGVRILDEGYFPLPRVPWLALRVVGFCSLLSPSLPLLASIPPALQKDSRSCDLPPCDGRGGDARAANFVACAGSSRRVIVVRAGISTTAQRCLQPARSFALWQSLPSKRRIVEAFAPQPACQPAIALPVVPIFCNLPRVLGMQACRGNQLSSSLRFTAVVRC